MHSVDLQLADLCTCWSFCICSSGLSWMVTHFCNIIQERYKTSLCIITLVFLKSYYFIKVVLEYTTSLAVSFCIWVDRTIWHGYVNTNLHREINMRYSLYSVISNNNKHMWWLYENDICFLNKTYNVVMCLKKSDKCMFIYNY